MYDPVHGMVPTGFHGLADLEHEHPGRYDDDPIAYAHVIGRKTLGTGGHLEVDEERLADTELHFMEPCVGRCQPGMPADVAGTLKLLRTQAVPWLHLTHLKPSFHLIPARYSLQARLVLNRLENSRRF